MLSIINSLKECTRCIAHSQFGCSQSWLVEEWRWTVTSLALKNGNECRGYELMWIHFLLAGVSCGRALACIIGASRLLLLLFGLWRLFGIIRLLHQLVNIRLELIDPMAHIVDSTDDLFSHGLKLILHILKQSLYLQGEMQRNVNIGKEFTEECQTDKKKGLLQGRWIIAGARGDRIGTCRVFRFVLHLVGL